MVVTTTGFSLKFVTEYDILASNLISSWEASDIARVQTDLGNLENSGN